MEVKKWEVYYKERQAVLQKVNEWQVLFEEHCEFKAHESDPRKYQNRGGNLETQLRVRKQ